MITNVRVNPLWSSQKPCELEEVYYPCFTDKEIEARRHWGQARLWDHEAEPWVPGSRAPSSFPPLLMPLREVVKKAETLTLAFVELSRHNAARRRFYSFLCHGLMAAWLSSSEREKWIMAPYLAAWDFPPLIFFLPSTAPAWSCLVNEAWRQSQACIKSSLLPHCHSRST